MNKERVISQRITKKYFDALKVAKAEMESNVFIRRQWEAKFKLSHRAMTTLKDLGIVKNLNPRNRKNASYEWNNKIPVSMLLVKKLILEGRRLQNEYIENTTLNKSQKPLVKKGNLGWSTKSTKPTDKRKLTQSEILEAYDSLKSITKPTVKQAVKPIQVAKKVSDVGLIRKFLRWIY